MSSSGTSKTPSGIPSTPEGTQSKNQGTPSSSQGLSNTPASSPQSPGKQQGTPSTANVPNKANTNAPGTSSVSKNTSKTPGSSGKPSASTSASGSPDKTKCTPIPPGKHKKLIDLKMDLYMKYMYRLSYERRGDISFIARGTISYFVTSERSERWTKYDIVTRAIKLILPSLECDNLFITYLCLYLGQKSDYIFTLCIYTLSTFRNAKSGAAEDR